MSEQGSVGNRRGKGMEESRGRAGSQCREDHRIVSYRTVPYRTVSYRIVSNRIVNQMISESIVQDD
jgi:ribosomal protein L15